MKPYSLEWWLHMHRESLCRRHYYIEKHDINNALRYAILDFWIRRRIINKYSEKEQSDEH
jgi:hypothetical protein